MRKILIFDTTLRDGEQCPGAAMGLSDKLRIARHLESMGVDVIEAGFPAASPGDFEAVSRIAEAVEESAVCALARAKDEDIDKAGLALAKARRGRIHTFIATSEIHMRAKLRMSPEAVLERIPMAIARARRSAEDVEFSAEDATRSEFDFLRRAIEAAIRAGARTVNIPDTVGYATPGEYGELIRRLREGIPDSDLAVFSAHCHDDLGLAAANSLAAAMNGAGQIECSVNGLGERAGNAPLEEIAMALRVRGASLGLECGIDARGIAEASRLVSLATGFAVAPNKAIVGRNAFSHASGIHQDGMLKERSTYEIMRAGDVGREDAGLALGKHSGRAALRERLRLLGLEPESEGELNALFARFKAIADAKSEVVDEDLRALVGGDSAEAGDRYAIVSVSASTETGERARARAVLRDGAKERVGEGEGVGVVDAILKALQAASGTADRVALYEVRSIAGGSDAQAEVSVRLERGGAEANGRGADPDIAAASAKAWASALSRLERESAREADQGLMESAKEGDESAAKAELRDGADPDAQNKFGWTALMRAASEGHLGMAKLLLGAGADPNRMGDDGSALHLAAMRGNAEMAALLLDRGASLDAHSASQYQKGWTPLMMAATMGGSEECVEELLRRGADLEARSLEEQKTALMEAAWRPNNERIIRRLLEAGADPLALDENGWTAESWALFHKNESAVRELRGWEAERERETLGSEAENGKAESPGAGRKAGL